MVKITTLSKKYNFSLSSKNEIISWIKMLSEKSYNKDPYIKMELLTLNNYYKSRLPIIIAKEYLQLNKNTSFTDNEILTISYIRHQREIIQQNIHFKKIKHIIDGLEYPCKIKYGYNTCECNKIGYIWSHLNEIKYPPDYWLQDMWYPLIYIKREPQLTMLDEFNIINSYKKKYGIIIQENRFFINNRSIYKRIHAYAFYYKKYWQWEHIDGEIMPTNDSEWQKYFATSGCSNHRDMIETVHIYFGNRDKNTNIDFRYGKFRLT